MFLYRKLTLIVLGAVFLLSGLILYSAHRRGQQLTDSAGNAQQQLKPITAAELESKIQNSKAKAVFVNIWASWCAPCRKEFPHLLKLRKKYHTQGLKLILVSADDKSERQKALKFLTQRDVDFPTYIKSEADKQFLSSVLPTGTVSLPASMIYNQKGKLVEAWQGMASFQKMQNNVQPLLQN